MMSTIPGYTLEEFLMWEFDLIVDGDVSANPSLAIAEAIGNVPRRQEIDKAAFRNCTDMFESYRARVERALIDYDEEENGSWRDFAGYAFDFIPPALLDAGRETVRPKKSP